MLCFTADIINENIEDGMGLKEDSSGAVFPNNEEHQEAHDAAQQREKTLGEVPPYQRLCPPPGEPGS
jgi:hypothetical protein